jgi:centromere/kinetochore protein ZW10
LLKLETSLNSPVGLLPREVLAPGIPSTVETLPDYDTVISDTEALQEFLVEAGLLPPTNVAILNYTRNVDALFANKLSQELLVKARDIMKEDLFVTVPITEQELSPLSGVVTVGAKEDDKKEEEELPVTPGFPLPEKLFQFPACTVSASTLTLLERAVAGLEQAAACAQPFCSVRLFNTVRSVFELWCAVVPTYHKAKLESLPQVAAVAHNSAMYLAHRCVTLGFLYRDRLPALAQHSLTFIDIVPRWVSPGLLNFRFCTVYQPG